MRMRTLSAALVVLGASACSVLWPYDELMTHDAADAASSTDATADAVQPTGTFCSSVKREVGDYCCDFDDAAVDCKWTCDSRQVDGGVECRLDTSNPFSAPNAFKVVLPADPGPSSAYAIRAFDRPARPYNVVRLVYRLRVGSLPTGAWFTQLNLRPAPDSLGPHFLLQRYGVQEGELIAASLVEPAAPVGNPFVIDLFDGEWHQLEVELSLTEPKVTLKIDGIEVTSGDLPENFKTFSDVEVGIGSVAPFDTKQASATWFDDFVLTFE
jgi:hypothetical protein